MPEPPREGPQRRNPWNAPALYAEDDYLSRAWDTRPGHRTASSPEHEAPPDGTPDETAESAHDAAETAETSDAGAQPQLPLGPGQQDAEISTSIVRDAPQLGSEEVDDGMGPPNHSTPT
eukprot:12882433-Prorocentrum_lima.AAC.1